MSQENEQPFKWIAEARSLVTDARDEIKGALDDGEEVEGAEKIIADCNMIARRCADIVSRLTK